ncbi:GspE/PulE family protein [Tundrisphaera lichenicola]|uniref:GspE/PulE family protein n=1 Tax=Tundrisphaera lichenicola TaxID=2029860 RepID=UPI003EBADF86
MPLSKDRNAPPIEQALGTLLVQEGLLSAEQLVAVQQYGTHNNLDLQQAILRLKLLTEVQLREMATRVQAYSDGLLGSNGSTTSPPSSVNLHPSSTGTWRIGAVDAEPVEPMLPTSPPSPTPNLAQRERDIRQELKEIAATAGSPDLVAQIFDRAYESRATDIHFDPQETYFRVRYRIDGQLHDVLEMEPAFASSLVSRIKVMADLNIVERRHSQDGRIRYLYRGQMRDLRVATVPTVLGEKIVVRIHEALSDDYGFNLLGLEPAQAEQLAMICSKPYGAVLVAGPVGAGKTTTLYTCLNQINSPTRNLMTIEDPIERRLPGVNQIQVDHKVGLSFGSGLKAMLRQDPDVLMIGEIRDDETAHIGIRAALTGVLVLSTIHASDAPSTLGNLYDFKIPGYLLSNALLAVISQRLLRKVCPYCRVSFEADERQLAMLGLDPAERAGTILSRGEGCTACFQTGYLGRSGIFEILQVNDTIRELIFQQISKDVLRQVATDMGMRTLKDAAVDKVLEGSTTLEEIYRVVMM